MAERRVEAAGDGKKAPRRRSGDGLTHLDREGHARMVEVGDKPETRREAVVRGLVTMRPATRRLIRGGRLVKGDALAAARLAGIMAAKRTADRIPLCHPIPLSSVEASPRPTRAGYEVTARARTTARTGVEMEALTSVAVAALTLYDMAKAVDREMVVGDVRLLEKRGGRSGDWMRPEPES